jgi:putative redox protein
LKKLIQENSKAMAKHTKTTTVWKSGQAFTSHKGDHSIELDGHGFNPKALLLTSLASCSGIDVVLILEKMKVPFADLQIDAGAEQTETDPKVFQDIHVHFRIKTGEENRGKVKRAIDLSLDKYCGVAAMLRKNSKIDYTLEILPEEV